LGGTNAAVRTPWCPTYFTVFHNFHLRKAKDVLRYAPYMMWPRTGTSTYFRAWVILFVVSMSSLEGSISYLQ